MMPTEHNVQNSDCNGRTGKLQWKNPGRLKKSSCLGEVSFLETNQILEDPLIVSVKNSSSTKKLFFQKTSISSKKLIRNIEKQSPKISGHY